MALASVSPAQGTPLPQAWALSSGPHYLPSSPQVTLAERGLRLGDMRQFLQDCLSPGMAFSQWAFRKGHMCQRVYGKLGGLVSLQATRLTPGHPARLLHPAPSL